MTDKQRIARIEFVKNLLLANGFEEVLNDGCHSSFLKYAKFGFMCVVGEWITIYEDLTTWSKECVLDNQSLRPLRDFIKLSNQKQL